MLETKNQQRSGMNITTTSLLIIAITANEPDFELLQIDAVTRAYFHSASSMVRPYPLLMSGSF